MSDTAVLVIDMFNDYDHPDGDRLADNVAAILDPLVGLIGDVGARDDVDLIYVNDNHGDFTADRGAIIVNGNSAISATTLRAALMAVLVHCTNFPPR